MRQTTIVFVENIQSLHIQCRECGWAEDVELENWNNPNFGIACPTPTCRLREGQWANAKSVLRFVETLRNDSMNSSFDIGFRFIPHLAES